MVNFLKSLFSSSAAKRTENETDGTTSKADRKNFDMFKYDGIRAQRIGQSHYAVKCFEEVLNIREDYETMGFLVTAYLSVQELEKALEISNRMVTTEPEEPHSYLTRVNVLFIMDKEEESIEDCLKTIELDETNYVARFMLGKARRSTRNYPEAIADLTKAVDLKNDFISAWLLRADIYLETGEPEKALSDVEKAIVLAPEEDSAYLLRGRIHEAMNNLKMAVEDYNRALELNPFNEEAAGKITSPRSTPQPPEGGE